MELLTRYKITPEFYDELRNKVLNGEFVQAIKSLKENLSWVSLGEARDIILSEFKLERKLSEDRSTYACIRRIEQFEGLNNLPIAGDIGILLEYAREQLSTGLRTPSL